eukprot:gene12396-biopygen7936
MAGRQTGHGHGHGGACLRVGFRSVPGRCICRVLRSLLWDCCCGGPLGRLLRGIPMHVGFCSSYSIACGRRHSAIFPSTGGVARTSCRRLDLQKSIAPPTASTRTHIRPPRKKLRQGWRMDVRACRPRRKLLHCGSSYGAAGNSPLGWGITLARARSPPGPPLPQQEGCDRRRDGDRRGDPPAAQRRPAATGPRGEAAGRPPAPPASRGRLSLFGGEPVGVLSAFQARQRAAEGGSSRGSCWESLCQTTEAPTDRVRVWTRPNPTPTRGAQNAAQIKGNGRVRTTACTGEGTATSTVHSDHR